MIYKTVIEKMDLNVRNNSTESQNNNDYSSPKKKKSKWYTDKNAMIRTQASQFKNSITFELLQQSVHTKIHF